MVDEVKFDQLKRSGAANTKGNTEQIKRKSAMKAHQISKHGLPAEVMESTFLSPTRGSRWAVGDDE
jgi:hypothetical protein